MYKILLRSALAVAFSVAVAFGALGGSGVMDSPPDTGWGNSQLAGPPDTGWGNVQAEGPSDTGWGVAPAETEA